MKIYFLFLIFISTQINARSLIINKDHSEIRFRVAYMAISEVTGSFKKFRGKITFDKKSGIPKSIQITISPASIDTGNAIRDNHLRGRDFFNGLDFPEISFNGNQIEEKFNSNYLVRGLLKIKNVEKEVAISFNLAAETRDIWGNKNRFSKFNFSLNREDYGLKWNKMIADNKFLVGKIVHISGQFQLQPANSLTNSSVHLIPDNNYMKIKEKVSRGDMSREDFEKKLKEFDDQIKENKLSNRPQIKSIGPKRNQVVLPAAKDSTAWFMISFGFLSFFALIGCFQAGLWIRNMIVSNNKIRFNNVLGNFALIFLLICYAVFISDSLGRFY